MKKALLTITILLAFSANVLAAEWVKIDAWEQWKIESGDNGSFMIVNWVNNSPGAYRFIMSNSTTTDTKLRDRCFAMVLSAKQNGSPIYLYVESFTQGGQNIFLNVDY